MSRRSFRAAFGVVVVSLALVGIFVTMAVREALRYPDRRHAGKGREVEIVITRGMRFPEVAQTLATADVIDRPSWFRLYAMHRGQANRVRAGKYVLRDDLSPRQVLDTLVAGVKETEVQVTIPEGLHILEVFEILEGAGVAKAADLERIARDPEWLKSQGITGETAEGYLFPETYRFKKGSAPAAVLAHMVKQHRIVYDELARKHARSLDKLKKKLGWGDREIVIMASIVEKEAVSAEERPRVASVFYNRLTFPSFTSRKLETDPTIRYGCMITPRDKQSAGCRKWDKSQRLRRAQLDDKDNLYNTYQHPHLPPGPISNPGRASIAAAMDPEETQYLFFVAKDPRTHVFSKTFAEHNRWVEKYMK